MRDLFNSWDRKGFCLGTLSPSSSPVQYLDSNCYYYEGTTPHLIEQWSESRLSSYTSGSHVRIHNRIYKCKNWPFNLWCKMAAYEPEQNSLHLNDAWVKVSSYEPDGSTHWFDAWQRVGTCISKCMLIEHFLIAPLSIHFDVKNLLLFKQILLCL